MAALSLFQMQPSDSTRGVPEPLSLLCVALRPPFGGERGRFLSSASSPRGSPGPSHSVKSQRRPLGTLPTRQLRHRSASLRRRRRQQAPRHRAESFPVCVDGAPLFRKQVSSPFIRTFSSKIRQRVASHFLIRRRRLRLPCVTRERCRDCPQCVLMMLLPGECDSFPAGASGCEVLHEGGYSFRSKGSKNSPRIPFS